MQGGKFKVITDHLPLVGIFRKPLAELENMRLLRFRERLTHFSFTVSYAEGKTHFIADALSRAPVFDPPENEYVSALSVFACRVAADPALQGFFDAARADDGYSSVVDALKRAVPLSSLPPQHPARLLRSCWDDLSVLDDTLLILNDSRIVVPKQARPQLLNLLHASHSGITKTRKLAQTLYFWPGMGTEIANVINNCDLCQNLRPSLHAVPQQHPPADAPMHSVSADLFEVESKHYIVVVDRFSNYMWVQILRSLITSSITATLERWFLEFGYPFILMSDGGPQFRTEFDDYC